MTGHGRRGFSALVVAAALALPAVAHGQGLAESMNEAQKALSDAELLGQQGKAKEARAQYLQAIRLNPRFSRAFEQYSLFLFSRGRHREGVKAVNVGIKLNPERTELKAHLAMHLYRLGRIVEAYQLFRESARTQADRYEIQVVYSQAAMLMEDYPAVIEAIRAYLQHRPDSLAGKDYVLRVQLATAYMRSGKVEEAGRELDDVLGARPKYTRGKIARAELLLRRGRCQEAEEAYRQLAPRLKKVDLSLQLGETQLCLRRYRQALDLASAFLEKNDAVLKDILQNPESRRIRDATAIGSVRQGLLLRANAALRLGMPERALEDFRKAEILSGGDRVELWIAQAHFQLKQYAEAIAKLRRQIERKDTSAEALVLTLRAAVRAGDGKLAQRCAERLTAQPKPAAEHLYYAGIAYNSAGRFERAVEVLERALVLLPGDGKSRDELQRAHLFLGRRAFRARKLDVATAQMRAALKLDPRSAAAHRNLAILYLKQDKPGLALEQALLAASYAPRDAATNRIAGRALALSGRHKDAIVRYQGALRELGKTDTNTQAKLLVELAVSRIATGALGEGAADLEQAASLVEKNERMAELLAIVRRDMVRARIARATELLDKGQTQAAAKELNLAHAQIKLLPAAEQSVAQVMSLLGNIHAGNYRTAREQLRGFQDRLSAVLRPTYQEIGAQLMAAYLDLHAAAAPGKQKAAADLEKLAAGASSPARERLKDLAASVHAQAGERAYAGGRGAQARQAFAKVKRLARRETPELKHNMAVVDFYAGARDEAVKALQAVANRVPMALCNLGVAYEVKAAIQQSIDFFQQCDQKGVRFPNLKALLAIKKQIFGK